MKVAILLIGAFGTVTKGLLKSLEDLKVEERVETIQTTARLQDSSQYSGRSQQFSSFDGLHSSANFQVLQSL